MLSSAWSCSFRCFSNCRTLHVFFTADTVNPALVSAVIIALRVAVGIVLGLYPVLEVLRVLVAALYGAFRGLG